MYVMKNYSGMIEFIRRDIGLRTSVNVVVTQSNVPNVHAWFKITRGDDFFGVNRPKKSASVFLQRSSLRERDFEATVVAMAHELSHLTLLAKGCPLWICEEAVELATMVLGYRDYYTSTYKPRQAKLSEALHLNRVWEHPLRFVGGIFDILLGVKVMKQRRGALTAAEVRFAVKFIKKRSVPKYQNRVRPAH